MAKIRKHMQSKISNGCITKILKAVGIWHWKCKRRPYLTDEVAAKRLAWCLTRKDWTVLDFMKYIFTDECSAERGAGGAQEWAWCQPVQKWNKEMVTTYKKGKDISVMVWAAIWWKDGKVGKSELYILERDWESKKHGYSANSYIDVLEDQLPKIWEPGMIFMQDNAPIHTANKTKAWFREMGILLVDWPPYSPDLNPIEHIWWHLKAKVLELYPDLKDLGTGEEAKEALERALIEAWDLIDETIIESCLESMCRRRDAVIAAKGWHTKY
jgi:transposase